MPIQHQGKSKDDVLHCVLPRLTAEPLIVTQLAIALLYTLCIEIETFLPTTVRAAINITSLLHRVDVSSLARSAAVQN